MFNTRRGPPTPSSAFMIILCGITVNTLFADILLMLQPFAVIVIAICRVYIHPYSDTRITDIPNIYHPENASKKNVEITNCYNTCPRSITNARSQHVMSTQ
jgi:hypothetical protein